MLWLDSTTKNIMLEIDQHRITSNRNKLFLVQTIFILVALGSIVFALSTPYLSFKLYKSLEDSTVKHLNVTFRHLNVSVY